MVGIAVSELDDPELLKSHLRYLAHMLDKKGLEKRIDEIDLEKSLVRLSSCDSFQRIVIGGAPLQEHEGFTTFTLLFQFKEIISINSLDLI